jgi:hypothetical protein
MSSLPGLRPVASSGAGFPAWTRRDPSPPRVTPPAGEATPPSIPPAAPSRACWRRSALALATVGAGMLAFGMLDARRDAAEAAARAESSAAAVVAVVRPSATEAAYQLNADLARHVVAGLVQHEAVAAAVLADNFGQTLAAQSRAGEDPGSASREVPLWYPASDGATERVGTLKVTLSEPAAPSVAAGWSGLARAALLAAVALILLHAPLPRRRRAA